MHPSKLYDTKFALAFVSNVLFVMANTLLLVHFARWVTFLGGDDRDVGWIIGMGTIPAVALRPWIGRWIDRIGPRRTWAAGYVLLIATALAYLGLTDIGPAIYILRMSVMLAAAIVFTSMLAYLSHTSPPTRFAEAIGSFGAAGLVGVGIGPTLGDLFFLTEGERTFREFVYLFGAAAGLSLVALLTLPLLRPTPPHPEARGAAFFSALRRHRPGVTLLVCFGFGVCMAVQFGFVAKFVDEARLGSIGFFFGPYATWAIFLRIVFRTLPQRLGRRRQLTIGMTLMAVGMVSYVLVDAWWMLILPALFCGAAHALTFPPMTALVMESFPPALRGIGSATALMALDAGMVTGAPMMGWIAFHFGYPAMFASTGAIAAAVIVAFHAARLLHRPEEATPTLVATGEPAGTALPNARD